MRVVSGRTRELIGTAEEREAYVPRRPGRVHRWYTPEGQVHEWVDGRWMPRGREAGASGARVGVDVSHQAQHDGRAWRAEFEADLGSGGEVHLHLRTGSRRSHLLGVTWNAEVDGCRLDLWVNQTVTAGTATHPVQPYALDGAAYGGALYTDSSVTLDTAVEHRLLLVWQFGSPGGGPVAAAGGVAGSPWGPVIPPNTDLVWRLQEPQGTGGVDRAVLAFDIVEDLDL